MAFGYDGTVKIDSSIDSKGFNKGIQSMLGSVMALGAAIGVAFGLRAITQFGQSAVDEASKMSSALIGLQSVVEGTGNNFGVAQKFITDYVKDGLVPAGDAITAYKNLLLRGYDTSQIESTLNALKDSAAFGRSGQLTIGEAVKSAAEGLKNENSVLVDNAGVSKNVSVIWKEYADSIGKTVAELTKAEKIQAEVNGILEETKFQTGDASKLAGTYAGQMSALGVSILNLKVAVGNSLIPIIQKILPFIRAAVDALTAFFQRVQLIIGILFGVDVGAQTTQSMTSAADATNEAADAQDNLADATENAGRKAKGALAAFDQLNVLQQPDQGGGATPATDAIGGADIALPPFDTTAPDESLDALRDKVEAFRNKLIELFAPAKAAFDTLVEALKPIGGQIWDGLVWVWENVLVPLGEWTITDLLPAFIDALAAAFEFLNPVIEALKPLWQWVWENILVPAAEFTGAVLVEALHVIADGFRYLAEWVENNNQAFQTIVAILTVVGGVILLIAGGPIAILIAAIVAVIAIIANWGAIWDWISQKAQDVWKIITNTFVNIGVWFKENVVTPFQEAWASAFDYVHDAFVNTFEQIKFEIKSIINEMIDFINGLIQSVAGGINSVVDAANAVGSAIGAPSLTSVSAPQIPHLATGAVIPPNSQFLAVLGDQRSGNNIEAPEGLIRKIIQEELGNVQAEVTINFEGSMASLVRELKPFIDKENVRVGKNFVTAKGTTS